MTSILSGITVLLLSALGSGVDDNACQTYKNLSDPWRNIGFFFSGEVKNRDENLTKGWYNLGGIGGDRLVQYCPNEMPTAFPSNNNFTKMKNKLYPCNSSQSQMQLNGSSIVCLQQGVPIQNCDGGVVLYYLAPKSGMYASRHSSCRNSSCGRNAHCSVVRGSCECDAGFYVPDGVQPSGDSYGCTDFYVTESDKCKTPTTMTLNCVKDLIDQIQNSSNREIPQPVMVYFLDKLFNGTSVLKGASNETELLLYGNSVLKATETLVSTLVKKSDTHYYKNLSVESMEAAVFVIGRNVSLTEIPQMNTSNASLNISLTEFSKNNKEINAVMFLSYNNMAAFLKPSFYHTNDSTTEKIMISTVITVKLLSTEESSTSSEIPEPTEHLDITIQHNEIEPEEILSCVNWNETEWVEDSCTVIEINSSFTKCFCVHPGTFALIMQTNASSKNNRFLDLFNTVAVAIGLVFLSLALLTLAFHQKQSVVINTALINLCISLFLAHLLFLITQKYLLRISLVPTVCAALAGVLHFLFLSAFVWMLIEAVLLFILVKNLTRIRTMQQQVLDWKCLIIVGYVIPLVVVGVSVGLVPDGYGSDQCWLKIDKGFLWSFLGPVCIILASNLILFIIIGVTMMSTLRKLNNPILQVKVMNSDKRLVKSVMVKTLLQFVIIGCFWIPGFFVESNEVLKVLFLAINSQQGTFIFFIHCVLNSEIRQHYKRLLCRFCYSKKSDPETTET